MKKGFSIIELLVVISIIALISSFIFVQLQQARSRARDAERETEIKTLQNAFALFVINNKVYPVYSGPLTGSDTASSALITGDAISQIPLDPFNSGKYQYVYNSVDGSTYTIIYYLETDSIPGKTAGIQTASP